jgi:uncharacterized protein (TIGR02594 family)
MQSFFDPSQNPNQQDPRLLMAIRQSAMQQGGVIGQIGSPQGMPPQGQGAFMGSPATMNPNQSPGLQQQIPQQQNNPLAQMGLINPHPVQPQQAQMPQVPGQQMPNIQRAMQQVQQQKQQSGGQVGIPVQPGMQSAQLDSTSQANAVNQTVQQHQFSLNDALSKIFGTDEGKSIVNKMSDMHPELMQNVTDMLDDHTSTQNALKGVDMNRGFKPVSIQSDPQQRINNVMQTAQSTSDPFKIASSFIGMDEHKDSGVLGQFFKKSMGSNVDPAHTPWCAAFANSVLAQAGVSGTGSLAARSFLNFGTPQPTRGDIVVFSDLTRNNNPQHGHVCFYAGEKDGKTLCLGGNQSGGVNIKAFPTDKVLGYRRPPSAESLHTAINSSMTKNTVEPIPKEIAPQPPTPNEDKIYNEQVLSADKGLSYE